MINECNIYLENKEDIGHFKYGFAFKVCRDCYFNIRKKITNVQDVEVKYKTIKILKFYNSLYELESMTTLFL